MIDATRSETDTEIINAYWRGYNDACKKMEKINDNIKELTTVLNIVEKTLGFEMWQVKAEDIPDIISSILEKMAKRKVKVEGNGINEDIQIQF
jgi:translation initiation factor IF-1